MLQGQAWKLGARYHMTITRFLQRTIKAAKSLTLRYIKETKKRLPSATGRVRRSWELDYFMLLNNMRLPYGIVAFEFDLPDEIGSFKTIVYCCKLD